jgi:hypothetical protein
VTISVCESFRADHERLDDLLARVIAAATADDGAEALRLWIELDSALLTHLHAEDTHLISELLALHGRPARVLLHEHRHIRARLVDLGSAIRSHGARANSLPNFKAELRAHARTEDRLLYQWADAHLDDLCLTTAVDALGRKPTV